MGNIISCSITADPNLVEQPTTFKSPFTDEQIDKLFDYFTVISPIDIPDDTEMIPRIESIQYNKIGFSLIPKKYFVLLHNTQLVCEAMSLLMRDAHPNLHAKYKQYFDELEEPSTFADLIHQHNRVNPLFTSFLIGNNNGGVTLYKDKNCYTALHKLIPNNSLKLSLIVKDVIKTNVCMNHPSLLCTSAKGEVSICQAFKVPDINIYNGITFRINELPNNVDDVTLQQIHEFF